jgi:hypothetical protein
MLVAPTAVFFLVSMLVCELWLNIGWFVYQNIGWFVYQFAAASIVTRFITGNAHVEGLSI